MTIRPYGLVGHQELELLCRGAVRIASRSSRIRGTSPAFLLQNQYPRLDNPGPILEAILEQVAPPLPPVVPPNQESSSWAFGYAFDQYLWQPEGDAKHGVGVFFSFGVSDGNPNPIKYAFLAGIGGKGVPGRSDGTPARLGFARTQFSSATSFPSCASASASDSIHEDTFELYYNLSWTGWLSVTPDLQVVNPGLKKTLNPSGSGLMNVDTATIAGVRFRVRF